MKENVLVIAQHIGDIKLINSYGERMIYIIVILLIVLLGLFSLSSISQSYASAQQAQAAIEASRTAQIASTGNLVTILVMTLLIVSFLVAMAVIAYLVYRLKLKTMLISGKGQWAPGPNANFGRVGQPSANKLLPAMMTMLLIQMMRQQPGQNPQANQQFTLEEPLDPLPILEDDFWTPRGV